MGLLDNLIMKIGGKDPSNQVKGISVNESGEVKTEITGSNVAVPVDLQYHALETPLPIHKKTEREVLFTGEEVEPGEYLDGGYISIDTKGCNKMLFAVNCNKEWKINGSSVWFTGDSPAHLYPNTSNVQFDATSSNIAYPKEFVVGYRIRNDAASLVDALQKSIIATDEVLLRLQNDSEETATFRLVVIRIWSA